MSNYFTLIALIIIVDAIGWTAWALSGQMPADNFFIGTITHHLLLWTTSLMS